jgi:hypothetical protein
VTGQGTVGWLGSTGTQVDMVSPTFAGFPPASVTIAQPNFDAMQCALAFYLPRRIVSATRLRWKYFQGGTAAATNYVWSIADTSGRVITSTAATAFTGALNTVQIRSETLLATTTFEAGWYFAMFGVAAMTAASSLSYYGVAGNTSSGFQGAAEAWMPNVFLRSTTGGSTAPTTLLAFTDMNSVTAVGFSLPVPTFALSVG